MNTFMNLARELVTKARNWWTENKETVKSDLRGIEKGFDRITRNITRMMVIGIILNIIAAYFYPEFPERFPVIYGWFDGWLRFGEFAIKLALGAIHSFFTGNFGEFWPECVPEYQKMLQQFLNWLNTIRF